MEKKLSTSNTKNEILEAYSELLKQVEDKKSGQPKEIKETEEREKIVKGALAASKEGIINQIAGLKITLNSELEKIEESLVNESKKLAQVQEAIKFQEQRLNDLYGINATTDSVSVMLAIQKEKKESFELEMEQKHRLLDEEIAETKQNWEKDKKILEHQLKDDKDQILKQRKREEEEYTYNLGLNRKKDTDLYNQKKTDLEKELATKKALFEQEIKSRELVVSAAEVELKELREKAMATPKIIEQSVKEAVADCTEKLSTNYKFESQLKAKESESDIKLRDQEISNLKAKIKDIEGQLAQFASKAEQADKSAKDIAIKAIESSSNYKIIDRIRESKEEGSK
jgi:hypothetical protein